MTMTRKVAVVLLAHLLTGVSGPVMGGDDEAVHAHWAFSKVSRPEVPAPQGRDWARHPIDPFVQGKLESHGLGPSSPADRVALVRRATIDFLGLPPTPAEIDAFVHEPSNNAYNRLIDRLLASPRLGERWGRHWLDVVRYAQTNGYEYDEEKPHAWRYRDWVISAFNHDLPYDAFVRQQLAGDELETVTDASLIATAFYRIGPWDKEPNSALESEFDGLDDMLSTASSAFLGITIGCARCHDHPSDPFSQTDYYKMLAFIRGVKPYTAKPDQVPHAIVAKLSSGGETLAVREHGPEAPVTFVFGQGDPGTPGEKVDPAFPAALCQGVDALVPTVTSGATSSGRRRALAGWITRHDHPLTARVIVNRLWHHHFGRGLVETPNDFGRAGIEPSHPKLLDWLAAELMASGWSLKYLHRLIATSATYRQSSQRDAQEVQASAMDPANRLLWRQNIRRLEAEVLRDAILSASHTLNLETGGRGFFPKLHPEVLLGGSAPGRGWDKSSLAERRRRSVYAYAMRNMRPSLMEDFDCADQEHSTAVRQVTTVAPQALNLLNSELVRRASRDFAARLNGEAPDDLEAQIRLAYRYALGRFPTGRELEIGREYVRRQTDSFREQPMAIRIRPEVPSTMAQAFRDKNAPEDYFAGPRRSWRYYRGHWFEGMAENFTVVPERGPFALWEGATLSESVTIKGRLQFERTLEMASLILRARPRGDVFHGYEVRFEPQRGRVSLVRLAEEGVTLMEVPLSLQRHQWLALRIELEADRLRVWRENDEERLLIDVVDQRPLPGEGRFGIRSWGGELRLDRWTLAHGKGEPQVIEGDPVAETPENRALASFCNLLYNLNEFVYVD